MKICDVSHTTVEVWFLVWNTAETGPTQSASIYFVLNLVCKFSMLQRDKSLAYLCAIVFCWLYGVYTSAKTTDEWHSRFYLWISAVTCKVKMFWCDLRYGENILRLSGRRGVDWAGKSLLCHSESFITSLPTCDIDWMIGGPLLAMTQLQISNLITTILHMKNCTSTSKCSIYMGSMSAFCLEWWPKWKGYTIYHIPGCLQIKEPRLGMKNCFASQPKEVKKSPKNSTWTAGGAIST